MSDTSTINMSLNDYLVKHIPHRVNLLISFRERYANKNSDIAIDPEISRDVFRCMKDISMLMVRYFFDELGLSLRKSETDIKCHERKGDRLAHNFVDTYLTKTDLENANCYKEALNVLKAANRAVAHTNVKDINHKVSDDELIKVINFTEKKIKEHIYESKDFKLEEIMKKNDNNMHRVKLVKG